MDIGKVETEGVLCRFWQPCAMIFLARLISNRKVGKTPFNEPSIYIEIILLPRQARDKHRESTRKKEGVFLCFAGERDRCRALLNVRAASGRAWRRL